MAGSAGRLWLGDEKTAAPVRDSPKRFELDRLVGTFLRIINKSNSFIVEHLEMSYDHSMSKE